VAKTSFLASKPAFCLAAAFLMVILRLISFDYRFFFNTQSVPNHDMYQGAAFFVTSVHSMRLNGDIVWWNPISDNGYAQYYQSFFSPLAPTSHHIVFIIWAQIIRLFSFLNIGIPEYFQYLIINYIIFPFLTFLCLASFSTLIFGSRAITFLVLIVYTFSGIGLWNSAWFYFQESSSLFLLLATAIGMLKRPSLRRLALFLIAVLIQMTSLNYWTIYNSWFIAIVLGTYCWTHPIQFRRLCFRVANVVRQHKVQATLLAVMFVLVAGIWLVIISSIIVEQSANYIRSAGSFSVTDAYNRVLEIRKFTTELFNPDIYKALQFYQLENEMHNARYIGVFLLPFLALIPFYQWRRRERFLIISAVGVLSICLAPPILLALWEYVPFMDKIRHFFYFYTQYWQLMVVLLASTSMNNLIQQTYNETIRKRFIVVISGLITIESTCLLLYGIFSHQFPANDQVLQSNLYSALMMIIICVFILQMLAFPTSQHRHLFTMLILIFAVVDLTRYFWDVSLIDKNFTDHRWGIHPPLPASIQAALSHPWPKPDTNQGFNAGLFGDMPIANNFWPKNGYMYHQFMVDLGVAPDIFQKRELDGKPFDFYTSTRVLSNIDRIEAVFQKNPGALLNDKVLILHSNPNEELADTQISNQNNDLHFDVTNPEVWRASGMQPIIHENGQHDTWLVKQNPNLHYKLPLNVCLFDYSYIYIRMAVSSDIVSPTVQFYYQINGDTRVSEDRSVALPIWADGKTHTYAYDLHLLQLDRKSYLTGIRIDPVFEGSQDGKSWAQIVDFRLINGNKPSVCANQVSPASEIADDPNFTYTWDEWRYNTFSIDLNAPQAGWLLIRQLNDPLWKLTLDGKPIQPIRANFVGMAIPLPQGNHQLHMDYWPLARRLYWPAALLLEALLIGLFMISLRKNAAVPL
jgi:hypothetical protein